MQPFLAARTQRLRDLLEQGSDALRTSAGEAVDGADVEHFLTGASEVYRALDFPVPENEVLALRAELLAARRGVVLTTGERLTTRRREFERTVALRVLTHSLERVRELLVRDEGRLHAAREQLAPMVVYALQKDLITPIADGEDEGAASEARWRVLLNHPDTRAAAQQLLASTSAGDAVILLSDLLRAVADPPGP